MDGMEITFYSPSMVLSQNFSVNTGWARAQIKYYQNCSFLCNIDDDCRIFS